MEPNFFNLAGYSWGAAFTSYKYLFLEVLIPFLIWWSISKWKPTTRKIYALKFAFWPLILLSPPLGAQMMPDPFPYRLLALICGSLFLAPFAFGIGYFISRKKFK